MMMTRFPKMSLRGRSSVTLMTTGSAWSSWTISSSEPTPLISKKTVSTGFWLSRITTHVMSPPSRAITPLN
jgi:hypothetical protein